MAAHIPPKYVFVLVHADMWGAFNANTLVKAVKARGYEPVLIASRSTPGKDGRGPATRINALKAPRVLKEGNMLDFFKIIDALPPPPAGREPTYLTFEGLGKHYCADKAVHYTTRGGPSGGEEVAQIFAELSKQGIQPDLVLSGDTLAILPESITNAYPCFSLHPAPLDDIKIKGMQGTARSLTYNVLYDHDGRRLPRDHPFGMGLAFIKGSFFQQCAGLDEGPVIEAALTPVMPGMCLFQARNEIYCALTQTMISYLPQLMDPIECARLIETARLKGTSKRKSIEIEELDEGKFDPWLADGATFVWLNEEGRIESCQNQIVNPDYFKSQMNRFYPGEHKNEFGEDFERDFYDKFGFSLGMIMGQHDARAYSPSLHVTLDAMPRITIRVLLEWKP